MITDEAIEAAAKALHAKHCGFNDWQYIHQGQFPFWDQAKTALEAAAPFMEAKGAGMAVTKETLAILAASRADLAKTTDAQVLNLVIAWTQSWDVLKPEYDAAIAELLAAAKDGTVTAGQVRKSSRLRQAIEHTRTELESLAGQTNKTVTADLPDIVSGGGLSQVDVIRSQLPAAQSGAVTGWDRSSKEALTAMVQRSTENIHSATLPLPADVEQMMKRQLIRGIAVGDNPRATAARIVKQAEGRFNGGLTRAMTIARTETLDAHRAGAQAAAKANTDVLTDWVWSCDLSARTCPACLSMNGTHHDTEDPGPDGHQNCRCARVDVTKSWADLGFKGITEPEDVFPDAQAWFDGLTPESQLAIMGPARLELLQSGKIGWSDLASVQHNDGWRDSHVVTPVKDLLNLAA